MFFSTLKMAPCLLVTKSSPPSGRLRKKKKKKHLFLFLPALLRAQFPVPTTRRYWNCALTEWLRQNSENHGGIRFVPYLFLWQD